MDYRFQPDLSRAHTLPAAWYREPELLAREQRSVFGRTWQLVGRLDQLEAAGAFLTATVGREEVLVVRGEDGALRALSNVCRHRAGPVARGCGVRKVLQCGYHGWTYALDGRLLATPEWEGVQGFTRQEHGLPAFRVESWAGFVFVNLDPAAPPLQAFLGEIGEESLRLPLAGLRRYRHVDYEVACNWKVYVDNYLEGYHLPLVHPRLFREVDYGAYRVETRRYHSKQHAPIRSADPGSVYRRSLEPGATPEALYYWIFPNLMLNLYPDNLQTNLIVPLGPERTLTRFEWFLPDPERPGLDEEFQRSFAFSDEIQHEDIAICEAVQRGLRSGTYEQGRFSVARENGVHHFHGLLAEFLGPDRT